MKCKVSLFLSLLLLSTAFTGAAGQNTTATAPTLAEVLTISAAPTNEAVRALFPPSILFAQTPIAVRYSLFTFVGEYEAAAACDPVALSFLGTKDPIPPRLCTPDNAAIIQSYISLHLVSSEFPVEGRRYAAFLARVGLQPFSMSTDETTAEGWARRSAQRLEAHFKSDGWNSLGDATRADFRNPFEDSINYRPRNPAHLSPDALRFPLRWQPLPFSVDGRGNYAHQRHVTPHLSRRVAPLGLSRRAFRAARVEGPYATPDRRGSLSRGDERVARALLRDMLAATRGLSEEQRAVIAFWDNKFFSLASFAFFYARAYGVSQPLLRARLVLGDMVATHDALLLAWKEKVRHDLVRPTTLVRRLLRGGRVRAWRGAGRGEGGVRAEEWQAAIPVQPHSEFPSASAVLCTAVLEHLQEVLGEVVGGNTTMVPYEVTVTPGVNPLNPARVVVGIRFDSLGEAARSCGVSRLWAGLHFRPAVEAGFTLGKGTGRAAYLHLKDLAEGRVPKNCARCVGRGGATSSDE